MSTQQDHTATQQQGPAPILVMFLVVPLLGILGALLVLANDLRAERAIALNDLPQRDNTLVNREAPDFELSTLDGGTVRLRDLRGRTVFVNFWQTTCAPCVHELPDLADFERTYEDRVAVVTVNFDETRPHVRDFLASNDIVGVRVGMDLDSTVRRTYAVRGLPTTYIINPDGLVRFLQIGPMTPEDMVDYLNLVESTDPVAQQS